MCMSYMSLCVRLSLCVYICMYLAIHIICMYTLIYTYIYIYIDTHTSGGLNFDRVQPTSSSYDLAGESSFSPYVRKQYSENDDLTDNRGYGDGGNNAGNTHNFAGHNNNNNYSLNNISSSFANLNLNVHAEVQGTPNEGNKNNKQQLGGSDLVSNLYGKNSGIATYESGEVSAPVSYGAGEFVCICAV
jgi:hypothetical protein